MGSPRTRGVGTTGFANRVNTGRQERSSYSARPLWSLFEPVHAIVYFSDELTATFARAGLTGFWRSYFAGRAAPLGPVGPEPVIALFNGFEPAFVRRALPAVWADISPDAALAARRQAAAQVLRSTGEAVPGGLLAGLRQVVEAAEIQGRALGAANAGLERPDDPHEELWQLTTTLRELRGDGHVAELVAHDLAGITAAVLRCGHDLPGQWMQRARGWTATQWDAATTQLQRRTLLDGAGRCTPSGLELLAEVERATDIAAGSGWSVLSPGHLVTVARQLRPFSLIGSARLPQPNPIGVPLPWDPDADPTAGSVALFQE